MKRFEMMQVDEAVEYAAQGGQALHLHNIIVDYDRAPQCFIQAVKRGEMIAHLFDQNRVRLVATAKKLGVRVILVEKKGKPGQHIDLCNSPLKKAIAMCKAIEKAKQAEMFK